MNESTHQYNKLINNVLPARFTYPVQNSHCFARIILDWLFQDCWHHHLNKKTPAYKQLSIRQLNASINRMNLWLQQPQLLVEDNNNSLQYRKNNRKSILSQTGTQATLF